MTARRGHALLVGLVIIAPSPALAQGGFRWRPDERLILGDFSVVTAVAAGRSVVYGATRSGLIAYDRRLRRWLPPFTAADGFQLDQAVVSAAVDPADESLWLSTRSGLLHVRPALRDVEAFNFPGAGGEIAFDLDDPMAGVYLPGPLGWRVLQRGQLFPTPAPGGPRRRTGSRPVASLLQQFPAADALRGTMLLDHRLRQHHFTAAALSPEGDEVWFGTDGIGMVRLEALSNRLERFSYGFPLESIGAVAVQDGAVWVGSGVGGARPGLGRADRDLQSFDFQEPEPNQFRSVRDLLPLRGTVWIATDRGVMTASGGGWQAHGTADGLPSLNALALAADGDEVWVGTDRGISRIGGTGWPGPAVFALSVWRDTVWVGTAGGLAIYSQRTGDIGGVGEGVVEPALREPVVAIVARGDTLAVATRDRLLWKAAGRGWKVERALSPELGTLRTLAPDAGGVWVGGERGLAFYSYASRSLLTWRVPDDIPGSIQDVAVSDEHVWVATPAGLVRFTRAALLP